VLAGVGLAGLAGAISACSSGGSSSSSAGTGTGAGASAGAGAAPAATSASGGGSALTSTNQIPVGGGMVFSSDKVVVTQPTQGDFKGFSAVCTHMQCTVDQVADGTIDCPCHGSKFSVKDGSVVSGPAPSPLPAQTIKVTGTNIFLG
jgi:nitrite reductase/ring-hydroxylating ferredoxin subunit